MCKIQRMLLESLEAHNFRNLSGKIFWGDGPQHHLRRQRAGQDQLARSHLPSRHHQILPHAAAARGHSLRRETLRRPRPCRAQHATSTATYRSHFRAARKRSRVNGKRETVARYLEPAPRRSPSPPTNSKSCAAVPKRGASSSIAACVSLHHAYVQTLADYQRVIKQKNRLLQDLADSELSLEHARELIEPWNEQLVVLGATIHRARLDYVERLSAEPSSSVSSSVRRSQFATSPRSKAREIWSDYEALHRGASAATPTGRNRLRIRPHRPAPRRPGNTLRRAGHTHLTAAPVNSVAR